MNNCIDFLQSIEQKEYYLTLLIVAILIIINNLK